MGSRAEGLDQVSFTQTQLDTLDAAIASGTLKVAYDGREITYRSMKELREARDFVARGLSGSGAARITHVNPVFDRGL